MNSLLISDQVPRATFSVESSDRKIGGEVKITNQLSTDRQTVKLVEIFKGGSFEPTMDQDTEETLVFLNGSSIEIDGETKTATPNSLVRLTSGKAHKIFLESAKAKLGVKSRSQLFETLTPFQGVL